MNTVKGIKIWCAVLGSIQLMPAQGLAEELKQDGFTAIFDGKTLDGWHIMQKPPKDKYYATAENFFVRDGAITCFQTQPDRKGGLILSDGVYDDFELSFDFKNDWGCDSGIFLRCTPEGRGIQVLNDYLGGGCVGGGCQHLWNKIVRSATKRSSIAVNHNQNAEKQLPSPPRGGPSYNLSHA